MSPARSSDRARKARTSEVDLRLFQMTIITEGLHCAIARVKYFHRLCEVSGHRFNTGKQQRLTNAESQSGRSRILARHVASATRPVKQLFGLTITDVRCIRKGRTDDVCCLAISLKCEAKSAEPRQSATAEMHASESTHIVQQFARRSCDRQSSERIP